MRLFAMLNERFRFHLSTAQHRGTEFSKLSTRVDGRPIRREKLRFQIKTGMRGQGLEHPAVVFKFKPRERFKKIFRIGVVRGLKACANARNIVGLNMLRAFAHHVVCCCDLLDEV